jgi:hypothetical protein
VVTADLAEPERRTTQEFSTEAFRRHLTDTEQEAEPTYRMVRKRRTSEMPPAATPSPKEAAAERATVPPGMSALTPAVVREALGAAEHRDEIFTLLLRALLHRTSYAALLTVQGAAAIGRLALARGEIDADIREVLIPLDSETPFRQVIATASPYIGKVRTGDADIDGMIARMGGAIPPAALLLPITLRGRVVAVAFAHRGSDSVSIAEMSELLPLAGVAADAVSRLLVRAKGRATTPPEQVG